VNNVLHMLNAVDMHDEIEGMYRNITQYNHFVQSRQSDDGTLDAMAAEVSQRFKYVKTSSSPASVAAADDTAYFFDDMSQSFLKTQDEGTVVVLHNYAL
jgi:hypothetical protein